MAIQTKPRATEEKRVTVSYSDSINLIKDQVQWSPKGVSLLTKWPFRVGAEVEFAFDHRGERHCCTGVVVSCHPLQRQLGFYETVLYFVETPCSKLQKAACACQLAREQDALSMLPDEEPKDGDDRDSAETSQAARVRAAQAHR